MRLTAHEDGWIYGLFCAERKDLMRRRATFRRQLPNAESRARHDLKKWERLDDLRTPSAQQRNCVLHPEFVEGSYAFYTRPQE